MHVCAQLLCTTRRLTTHRQLLPLEHTVIIVPPCVVVLLAGPAAVHPAFPAAKELVPVTPCTVAAAAATAAATTATAAAALAAKLGLEVLPPTFQRADHVLSAVELGVGAGRDGEEEEGTSSQG